MKIVCSFLAHPKKFVDEFLFSILTYFKDYVITSQLLRNVLPVLLPWWKDANFSLRYWYC